MAHPPASGAVSLPPKSHPCNSTTTARPYGHRPDWAPTWWEHDDLHHTPGGLLALLDPSRFGQPGLLATGLRQLADHLDATVSVHRTARPDTDIHNGPDLDFTVEDEHHDWLDRDGWARRQLHRDGHRLAHHLTVRRLRLRTRHADGRPFTEAA